MLSRLALGAALAACSCGTARRGPSDGGPKVDFEIGSLSFHISSGAVVSSGGTLTFYLSDQPDTCQAIVNVPVGAAITFSLRIAPPIDGTTRATVVAPKPAPAAGEAVGGLTRATSGVKNASLDALDGSLAWTANNDGSITITSIDVGFAMTADRLTTGGLSLLPCSP